MTDVGPVRFAAIDTFGQKVLPPPYGGAEPVRWMMVQARPSADGKIRYAHTPIVSADVARYTLENLFDTLEYLVDNPEVTDI